MRRRKIVPRGGAAIPTCDYTYAPFGDSSATDTLAQLNPWRFSSEYADDELGCVYYNYRHYEPVTGRWLSRDPIGEDGGLLLYGVAFSSVSDFDLTGLFCLFERCRLLSGPTADLGVDWVLYKVIFDIVSTENDFSKIAGVRVKWRLAGHADCCCEWLWRSKKNTVAVFKEYEKYIPVSEQNIFVYNPFKLPLSVSSPVTLSALTGELIGVAVSEVVDNLGWAFVDSTYENTIQGMVLETKPEDENAGSWPAKPCDKK